MADVSPDYLRGFIVPHKLTKDNIWTSQSSFTQEGNLAGDPEPQQTSKLLVRSTGSQTTDTDIRIITRRAGHVGKGRVLHGKITPLPLVKWGKMLTIVYKTLNIWASQMAQP